MKWLNASRMNLAWKPKTTIRKITSLRIFLEWCGVPRALAEYKAPSPARQDPHPLPGGVADVLSMIEVAMNDEQKFLVCLTGLCGLRISEARAVEVEDFNLVDRTIRVVGKGGRERYVPISDIAWEVILPYVAEAVLNGDGTLVSYSDRGARKAITTLGARAGVQRRVASHDMRATCATESYNNSGGDIRAVQELMGHSSVTTTQVYVGTTMSRLRRAVNFGGASVQQKV